MCAGVCAVCVPVCVCVPLRLPQVVTDNEIFMYTFQGTPLVLRVTASRYPEDDGVQVTASRYPEDDDDDDDDDDGAAAGGGGKHCFRGLVEARTRVYVGPSTVFCSSASQKAVCEGLKLTGVEPMPERQTKNWCARARAYRTHTARPPRARAHDLPDRLAPPSDAFGPLHCARLRCARLRCAQCARHDFGRRGLPGPSHAAALLHRPHQGGA